MMKVEKFVFNEWQENCFVAYDETKEAVIIDCGAHSTREFERLVYYVERMGLKPVAQLCTHLHLDHIFGTQMVLDKWGLTPVAGAADAFLVEQWPMVSAMFGMPGEPQPPMPGKYLGDGDALKFGNSVLKVLETPGHSPGSLCFYSKSDNILFSGDVLFNYGVGRSDLPGGNGQQLYNSIASKLFTLPDSTKVYCGHGPETTIGDEKFGNPFM